MNEKIDPSVRSIGAFCRSLNALLKQHEAFFAIISREAAKSYHRSRAVTFPSLLIHVHIQRDRERERERERDLTVNNRHFRVVTSGYADSRRISRAGDAASIIGLAQACTLSLSLMSRRSHGMEGNS